MKVFITGGTGFVGTHLGRACLDAGHEVTALGTRGRCDAPGHPRFHYMAADATKAGAWQKAAAEADLIYNLAGRSIFHRWSRRYKQQLHQSRILTTRNLVDAMPVNSTATLISTSAVGYYGHCGDTCLTENAPPGDDFLARLALAWEQEAKKAQAKGARVVIARFGIVLGADGGALEKMASAFRSFMGGPLGDGQQWFPWIHIKDLLGALDFLARHSGLRGPFNLTAPNPVTNGQMAKALGRALGRPARMAVPAVMLKMMMGEMAGVLLNSHRAVPQALLEAGYSFQFDQIHAALVNLLESR